MDNVVSAFFTNNGTPATGLSPTLRIWEVDDTSNTLVVTDDPMTEVGDGFYKYVFASFNPLLGYLIRADGGAILPSAERYVTGRNGISEESIADQVWDEPKADHNVAGSTGEALTNIEDLVIILAKFERNRTLIDPTAKTLTIFDDDGTTPLHVFDLKDSTGTPSVTEVCERDPQ